MDKSIVLLKVDNKYVPIVETAIKIVEPEGETIAPDEDIPKNTEEKEATSLPPMLPSTLAEAINDPLNVSAALRSGPYSLNVTNRRSFELRPPTEPEAERAPSISELPAMFR